MKNNRIFGWCKGLGLSIGFLFISFTAHADFEAEINAAMQIDDEGAVLDLLENKAPLHDPAHAEFFGWVLRWSATQGYEEIVEYLLAKKVNPNLTNPLTGNTALHLAVENNDEEVVRQLVMYGANLNLTNNNLETPLHKAAVFGNIHMVEALLDKGANPNLQNEIGQTLIHLAAQRGHEPLVEYLLSNEEVDLYQDDDGRTPLHFAAGTIDSPSLMELFQEVGEDLDEKDGGGFTPFHFAVIHGKGKVAEFLLSQGADLHAINIYGQNALHLAAKFGQPGMIKFLLARGLDPNKKTQPGGSSPLHFAVISGKEEAARVLLLNQADLNATDDQGRTALHLAAQFGQSGMIKFLLGLGLDPNKKTQPGGLTPFHFAVMSGKEEAARVLLLSQADLNATNDQGGTALHLAAQFGQPGMIKFLLERGLDPNKKTSPGELSPLHFAASFGKTEAARVLLLNQADPNVVSKEGSTALHFSALKGNVELMKLLIENKANINLLDGRGNDALDYLAKGGSEEHREFVRLLFNEVTPDPLKAIFSSDKLDDGYKKHKDFALGKIKHCKAHLEEGRGENLFNQILEIGRNLAKQELAKHLDMVSSNLSLKNCELKEGTCEVCLEDGKRFACPAAKADCSNAKCASCSLAEAEQLLIDRKNLCAQCGEKLKPEMYDLIPGNGGIRNRLQEQLLRLEMIKKDPNWKFCIGENCPYGASFAQTGPKYLDCAVCDFKGCLECGKDHLGEGCASYLENRQAMMNLLKKGTEVPMRKLTGSEPDETHPLYLRANDPRLQEDGIKNKYAYIQDENDPHFYDGKYRPCPHCGVVTERIDGCNGMTCNSCEKQYHWNHGKVPVVEHDFNYGPQEYELKEGVEPHY